MVLRRMEWNGIVVLRVQRDRARLTAAVHARPTLNWINGLESGKTHTNCPARRLFAPSPTHITSPDNVLITGREGAKD